MLEPTKLGFRSQLQVDASPNLKQVLKQIAADQNTTLKVVVLTALAEKYPKLKPYVDVDLGKWFKLDDVV